MAFDVCMASVTNCDDCVAVTDRANQYAMLADCFGLKSTPEFERELRMTLAINCDDVPARDSRVRDCLTAASYSLSILLFDVW